MESKHTMLMLTGLAGSVGLLIALNGGLRPIERLIPHANLSAEGGGSSNIKVASLAELSRAIAAAKGGETITLAVGSYGNLALNNLNFPRPVTITSPLGSAVSIEQVNLSNVTNITFNNISLGRALRANEASYSRLVSVSNARNIYFKSVTFHGSMDGNPRNDGQGLTIQRSSEIEVEGCEFTQLALGLVISESSNITVLGNRFHDIRVDGMNVASTKNIRIDQNKFYDFYPVMGPNGSGDHPDAIQFFTLRSNSPSTDIFIANNQILQGAGLSFQGIFLTDQTGTFPYGNVTIRNNLIYVRGYNAIMVSGGYNVSIEQNSTISPNDDKLNSWIRTNNIQGLTLSGNISDQFAIEPGPHNQNNNIELRTRARPSALIPGINDGEKVDPIRLTTPGVGYQVNPPKQ